MTEEQKSLDDLLAEINKLSDNQKQKLEEERWGYLASPLRFIKRWYIGARSLPTRFSEIQRWVGRYHYFVSLIAHNPRKPLKIEFVAFPTAYTDGETIYLPMHIYDERYWSLMHIFMHQHPIHSAIMHHNGYLVHEAAHVRYTFIWSDKLKEVFTIPKAFKLVTNDTPAQDSKLFKHLFNLIEDMYIDLRGTRDFRNVYHFTNLMGDTFFFRGLETFDKFIKSFEDEPTLDNMMNLLMQLRSKDLWSSLEWPVYLQEVVDMILEIMDKTHLFSDPYERTEKIYEIYLKFKENLQEHYNDVGKSDKTVDEEEQFYEKENSDGTTQDGKSISDLIQEYYDSLSDEEKEEFKKTMQAVADAINQSLAEGYAEELNPKKASVGNSKNYKKYDKDEILDRSDLSIADDIKVDDCETIIVDVMTLSGKSPKEVEQEPAFNMFASVLKKTRIRKAAKPKLNENGTDIDDDNLQNLFIPGQTIMCVAKMLARRRGEPEIVFMVDASGSTGAGDGISGSGKTVYDRQVMAVRSGSASMVAANMRHSVWAHTSGESLGTRYSDACYIYGIYSYKMPFIDNSELTHNMREHTMRFEQAHRIDRSANYDGIALEVACQMFSVRHVPKIVVMMSDGLPSDAPAGHSPTAYLEQKIHEARNRDIGVISISTVAHVVPNNNRIYGEEFSIDGSEGKLSKEIQKLINTIAGRKK